MRTTSRCNSLLRKGTMLAMVIKEDQFNSLLLHNLKCRKIKAINHLATKANSKKDKPQNQHQDEQPRQMRSHGHRVQSNRPPREGHHRKTQALIKPREPLRILQRHKMVRRRKHFSRAFIRMGTDLTAN